LRDEHSGEPRREHPSIDLVRIKFNTSFVQRQLSWTFTWMEAEVDFIADNPGLRLFHCHQQLHLDYGFMTLFDYV
jgi:FtsP/CotA-like multicopper oxidase with cupredoxin domain